MRVKGKRYINRDLSWLQFNARVLQEAEDPSVPLIERMRFLGIFSNNLDEFYRVRYAAIKRLNLLSDSQSEPDLTGYKPDELLHEITQVVVEQQRRSQHIHDELVRQLEENDIIIPNEKELTSKQKEFVKKFFVEKVSPAVFTLIINGIDRIPELRDKSIYLAIKLVQRDNPENPRYALIEVPAELIGRFVELPKYGKQYIMYLEDLIRFNLNYIFFIFDFDEIEAHTIKITRDAELDLDNDISTSFLEKMALGVQHRRSGDPVRLVYDKGIPSDLLQFIVERMDLDNFDSLIAGGRYHNKKDFIKFPNVGGSSLVYSPVEPLYHPDLDLNRSILEVIRKKDVLLFLPYHTFSYYIRFLREAAIDPDVKSIKITLYRLADKSRIISALINAAKNGKEVTVVIELQARFDEANNIRWTQELEQEGVRIIFGVRGLKVHSKVCIIRRKEGNRYRDYAALGTGNLNEATARFYTDYHLLTSDKKITNELNQLFDFFDANYLVKPYEHLIVSPHFTRSRLYELIDTEIANARSGRSAQIWIKVNSLSDIEMIDKLYLASSYGVKIKLIVRGICSLIPGKKGLSENIEAISIVDQYLEHTRIFAFENGGDAKYFIGSADLMNRNIDYRVEVTVPIYNRSIQKQLMDHFNILWSDNVKARRQSHLDMNPYRDVSEENPIRGQRALYDYVKKQLKKATK
jgi:polyphosphate kinase